MTERLTRCRSWLWTACRRVRRTATTRARSSRRLTSCCRRRAARGSRHRPAVLFDRRDAFDRGDRRWTRERQQSRAAAVADRGDRCTSSSAAHGRAVGARRTHALRRSERCRSRSSALFISRRKTRRPNRRKWKPRCSSSPWTVRKRRPSTPTTRRRSSPIRAPSRNGRSRIARQRCTNSAARGPFPRRGNQWRSDSSKNSSSSMTCFQGRILERAGHPAEHITVKLDFRGPTVGDFVYHCHILDHEDAGMMAIIRVLPNNAPKSAKQKPV